jgi:FkbM family methyltransferase
MKNIIKLFYELIPLKKILFLILKKIWSPPKEIYQHLYFKSVFEVNINKSISFKINHFGYQIENEIFWGGLQGGWESESIKLWIKLCRDAHSIIDIGANTGIYSLIANAINSNATIYSFEPVNRVFKKLKKNIELNNFKINPIEMAVSNFTGTAKIYDTQSEHIYSVTVNKNLSEPDIEVSESIINTITLDAFIDDFKLKNIDLIKIDVETHEAEVIEGFSKYISIFMPTILIEVLNDEIGIKLQEQFDGLGYLYFNIDERLGPRHVEKITKSFFYNYLLCSESTALKLGLILKEKIKS